MRLAQQASRRHGARGVRHLGEDALQDPESFTLVEHWSRPVCGVCTERFRQRLVVITHLRNGFRHAVRARRGGEPLVEIGWVQVMKSRPRSESHERKEAAALRHWVATPTWDLRNGAFSTAAPDSTRLE